MQRAKKRPFRRVFYATRSFNGRGGGNEGAVGGNDPGERGKREGKKRGR